FRSPHPAFHLDGICRRIDSAYMHRARSGFGKPEHHEDGGRLARPVRAKQPEYFSLIYGKIETIYRREVVIPLSKSLKFDNRLVHRLPPSISAKQVINTAQGPNNDHDTQPSP